MKLPISNCFTLTLAAATDPRLVDKSIVPNASHKVARVWRRAVELRVGKVETGILLRTDKDWSQASGVRMMQDNKALACASACVSTSASARASPVRIAQASSVSAPPPR